LTLKGSDLVRKPWMCICIIAFCLLFVSCSSANKDNIASANITPNSSIVENTKTEHEINMNAEQKKKINIFLSNFAECLIDSLIVNEVSEEQLISFAVSHNYKNNYNLWLPGDSIITVKIDAKFIEKTIEKYFNIINIKHKSVGNNITFKNGYYYINEAAGEYIPFVHVNKLVQGDDGSMIAYGDVCGDINNLSKNDPYEPLEKWTDEEKKEIELYHKVKAEFKEIENNGQKRYVLIEYSSIK
jgi:hypothetical protein